MAHDTKKTEKDPGALSDEELGKLQGGGVLSIPIGSVKSPAKPDIVQNITDGTSNT